MYLNNLILSVKFTAENTCQYIKSTWHLTCKVSLLIEKGASQTEKSEFSHMNSITFLAFSCKRNGCSLPHSLAGASLQGSRGEEGFSLHASQSVFSLSTSSHYPNTHTILGASRVLRFLPGFVTATENLQHFTITRSIRVFVWIFLYTFWNRWKLLLTISLSRKEFTTILKLQPETSRV